VSGIIITSPREDRKSNFRAEVHRNQEGRRRGRKDHVRPASCFWETQQCCSLFIFSFWYPETRRIARLCDHASEFRGKLTHEWAHEKGSRPTRNTHRRAFCYTSVDRNPSCTAIPRARFVVQARDRTRRDNWEATFLRFSSRIDIRAL